MRKLFVGMLAAVMLCSLIGFSCAANQSFTFHMTNTGTTMYVATTNSNQKLYTDQDATVKVNSVNAAGYGYRLALVNSSYTIATSQKWYNYNGQKKYHSFLSGMSEYGMKYYMCGRIDNDYDGPYDCSGLFNSDKSAM